MDKRRGLVIGLGNLSRRDDGFGWFAINEIRTKLGQPLLGEWDDGFDELGKEVDSIFVPQLSPELAELALLYRRLAIVDARVGGLNEIEAREISPDDERGTRLLTHAMPPAEFIGVTQQLYGEAPVSICISAPGMDYDFGVGLSSHLAALLPDVAKSVLEWLQIDD